MEIKGSKNNKIFNFLNGCFSIMGDPINMIFDVFSETIVRFLKNLILHKLLKKLLKTWGPLTKRWAVLEPSNYMCLIQLYELSRMALVKFVAFAIFEILCGLAFMQKSLNVNNCWRRQNFENWSTWPHVHLWWTFRICCYLCVKLNIFGCKKMLLVSHIYIKWVFTKTRLHNNA